MPKGSGKNRNSREEGIYVEFKKVPALPYLHSYLVYEDGKGNREVIRGGPARQGAKTFDSKIKIQSDIPLYKSKDAYGLEESPETRRRLKLDLYGQPTSEVWERLNKTGGKIQKGGFGYDIKPEHRNSNSITRTILEENGFDPIKAIPKGIMPGRLPGYGNNLFKTQNAHKPEEDAQKRPGAHKLGNNSISPTAVEKPSPEIRSFLDDLSKPVVEDADILAKDPKLWTEEEVNRVHRSKYYQKPSSPRRDEAFGKVRQWYEHHYGTDPVKRDDTGAMIDPGFKVRPNKKPVPARGGEYGVGLKSLGDKIATVANKRGLPTAIKGAQTGLNLLTQNGESKGSGKTRLLKTDGIFGPKTKGALQSRIAGHGKDKVENATALGTFASLMDDKTGQAQGSLSEAAHDSFDPLFQKPKTFAPEDTSPKSWVLALQDTVNDVGKKHFGNTFKPIKEDGWIGPKTTDAFTRVYKPMGSGGFVRALGKNLGFF